jgi:hypothetical protein
MHGALGDTCFRNQSTRDPHGHSSDSKNGHFQ